MKLAISNLAWNKNNEEIVFKELNKLGIKYIEGVLSKIDSWENLNEKKLIDYKNNLLKNNLSILSIQSIFFNADINNIDDFNFIFHIKNIINFSKILGIKKIVFGSPVLRKKTNNLVNIFKLIDSLLKETDIYFLIEPNSKVYKGEYFFNLNEIIDFIEKNNLKNIKTMIDTHNLLLENKNPLNEYINYKDFIFHIHISENNLNPIKNTKFHKNFSSVLKQYKYNNIITLEMKENINIIKSINCICF